MSMVLLACDPANLQFIADVAHCSQWIAVDHSQGFFDAYASASELERQQYKQAVIKLLATGATFYFLWWAFRRL